MTVSVKAPTSTTGSIQLNGSDVLTIESDNSVDIDSGTLHVDATNNRVGIGTSSPSTTLDITTTGGGKFQVTDWGASSQIGVDTAGKALRINGTTSVRLHTGTAGSQSERMRIDSSGNLLIGTTSELQSGTNHSIHIKSSNFPQITYQHTGAATGGSYWVSGQSSNDYWYLLPAPQNKGVYLTYTSTTGWSAFSDETLKENLVPIENALDKINTLRTVTGNYIEDPDNPHVFLIAQDVQAILPEAVHMNLDHNVLGMNYNEIIPLLTAGIKELKAENDTLKSQLSALETRIEALEAK